MAPAWNTTRNALLALIPKVIFILICCCKQIYIKNNELCRHDNKSEINRKNEKTL